MDHMHVINARDRGVSRYHGWRRTILGLLAVIGAVLVLFHLRQTGNNATESEKPNELTVKLSTTEGELKGIRGVTHGFDGATARAELMQMVYGRAPVLETNTRSSGLKTPRGNDWWKHYVFSDDVSPSHKTQYVEPHRDIEQALVSALSHALRPELTTGTTKGALAENPSFANTEPMNTSTPNSADHVGIPVERKTAKNSTNFQYINAITNSTEGKGSIRVAIQNQTEEEPVKNTTSPEAADNSDVPAERNATRNTHSGNITESVSNSSGGIGVIQLQNHTDVKTFSAQGVHDEHTEEEGKVGREVEAFRKLVVSTEQVRVWDKSNFGL